MMEITYIPFVAVGAIIAIILIAIITVAIYVCCCNRYPKQVQMKDSLKGRVSSSRKPSKRTGSSHKNTTSRFSSRKQKSPKTPYTIPSDSELRRWRKKRVSRAIRDPKRDGSDYTDAEDDTMKDAPSLTKESAYGSVSITVSDSIVSDSIVSGSNLKELNQIYKDLV